MTTSVMQCYIAGIGAWGPGFNHWMDLVDIFNNRQTDPPVQSAGPKPLCIPANERRRAPVPVRLAIETSYQAAMASCIPASDLSCVFVSGFGDTDISNYLCQVLQTEEKLVSPTKFHNSVHNAAAGYWTISMDCMQSANSIAALGFSASMALLEGMALCCSEGRQVLVTFYDAPVSGILKSFMQNDFTFAASIVLTPELTKTSLGGLSASLKPRLAEDGDEWSTLKARSLNSLYRSNPAARILGLLEMMAISCDKLSKMAMPINDHCSLQLILDKQE